MKSARWASTRSGLRAMHLALATVVALLLAPAAARAHCALPDLPPCGCYVPGGAWPLPQVAGNLIGTARKSLPAQNSCLKHRGLPYWQIQAQIDDPDWAHFVAHWVPWFPTAFKPQAWCTETVAFWHRQAQVPYGLGYFALTWLSSYVDNARQLRLWYQTEEDPGGILAFFGYEGRGRWIGGSELDYSDFQPGVNAPCPGAYQCWEACNATTGAWEDSCFHSQVVDSMVVYRLNDATGPVQRVDVFVVEGNASGGSFVDINGLSVSRGKVRDDRSYTDVIDYTSLGDRSNACGLTVQKIRGWGIDLDADGNPRCDPGKITTIVTHTIVGHQAPTGPDDSESAAVSRYYTYFQATSGGNKSITTNASAIQTGGAWPSPTNPWTIPPGPLGPEPVYIQVDLLAEYPLPVRGVVVDWKEGHAPAQCQVWWAGQDAQIHTAAINLATGQTPPTGIPSAPVPAPFGPAPSYPVRYMRLVMSNSVLTRPYEIIGLHLLFDYGKDDDNGDVLEEHAPVTSVEDPAPAALELGLRSSRPNPFARATLIEYELKRPMAVEIRIRDVAGRLVRRIESIPSQAGTHRVLWDGRDEAGVPMRSGMYFCELRGDGASAWRKLLLAR